MLAKAHLFEAVLGDFPPDIVYRVSLTHNGLFDSSDELKGFYDLSLGLRESFKDLKTAEVSLMPWRRAYSYRVD